MAGGGDVFDVGTQDYLASVRGTDERDARGVGHKVRAEGVPQDLVGSTKADRGEARTNLGADVVDSMAGLAFATKDRFALREVGLQIRQSIAVLVDDFLP